MFGYLYFLSYIYIYMLNIYIVTICCLVCDVISFEINLSILIKPFFYITKKSEQKCKYFKNERAFNMKYKVFFLSFLLCFWLKQIKTTFLDCEGPTLIANELALWETEKKYYNCLNCQSMWMLKTFRRLVFLKIIFWWKNQARSQGWRRRGEGGREGLPPARLKKVQFALNRKHAFFDAMP